MTDFLPDNFFFLVITETAFGIILYYLSFITLPLRPIWGAWFMGFVYLLVIAVEENHLFAGLFLVGFLLPAVFAVRGRRW